MQKPIPTKRRDLPELVLRHTLVPADEDRIRAIVTATERFRPSEVDVAAELVRAKLAQGEASGYCFVLAEESGTVVGYACFGPTPCTVDTYDLYWMAVTPELQGRGVGQVLLAAAEQRIRAAGGRRVFIDTSARADYAPTRRFYLRAGYVVAAELQDFYATGDNKLIFRKDLAGADAVSSS